MWLSAKFPDAIPLNDGVYIAGIIFNTRGVVLRKGLRGLRGKRGDGESGESGESGRNPHYTHATHYPHSAAVAC